jgi:hypothetical protein
MCPAARGIAARARVPVLNPATTGYKAAEMALGLGVTHSIEAYRPAAGERLSWYRAMTDAIRALDQKDPRGVNRQAAE